jgi:tetratricopeptide (TPR) repeat protein
VAYQNKDAHFHTDGGALRHDALKAFENALKYSKNENLNLVVNHYKGILLKIMGKGEKAIVAHNNALKLSRNPWDRSASLIERASALTMLGRVEAAIQDYRAAIQITPMKRSAYLPLAMCYKDLNFLSKSEWYDFMKEIEDSMQSTMDHETKRIKEAAVLVDAHNIDVDSSLVYWALYFSSEKAGYYEKAWSYLEKAHRIDKTKKVVEFDSKEANVQRDSIISVFNRGFWPQNIGYPDTSPVFIVGMMRSGSTLLETMLDAHENVIGLGEDSLFNSNLPQFRDKLVATIAKQDFVQVKDLVNSFGAKIVDKMKTAAYDFINSTERKTITKMVDKMLFNYRNIGFIHLVYPNAVILHTIRDPMDTILSCYTHKFDDIGLTWSINQDHLTQAFAIYVEIMHHFRTVLPNRIMDVSYEELVHTPEEVMKKVVAKLGLPWDPEVLEYYKKKRMVQTHSSAQARKNIYKHSIGAWRKYLHQLIPAINTLKKYLKVLDERDALPMRDNINWDLDPFYDYKDDFKFNISKSEYLKLLKDEELKRKRSLNDDDDEIKSDSDDKFPRKLKRRRAKKQCRRKKKDFEVMDDGNINDLESRNEETERLVSSLYDIYSSTLEKQRSIDTYINKLKYSNENSRINELIALGNIFLSNDMIVDSIELFKKLLNALKYDKSDSKLLSYEGLSTAYYISKNYKQAIKYFKLLLEIDPHNIDALTKRSELLISSEELSAALVDMNKVVQLGGDNFGIRFSRGLSYFELGYFKKAQDDFQFALDFALRNNSNSKVTARIYRLLGQCEEEFGEIENSLSFHSKAIELLPNNSDYFKAHAIAAIDGGLWEDAIISLNKTLALNNESSSAYSIRGLLYQDLGMANQAILDFKRATTLDPNDITSMYFLGISFQSIGKYDQAFQAFDNILNIDHKNSVWFRKEFISYYAGKLDTEFKQFNIDNDFDPAIKEGIIEAKTTAFIPKSYVPYASITSLTYMRRQSIRNEPVSQDVTLLLNATKDMNIWMQIDSPGFLTHRRSHLMFRFCVLEIAQALKNHVTLLHEGKEGLIIPDRMSSKRDYYGVRAMKGGNHILGWRDLYDIAVRWIQLTEPKDPVWWNDKLSQKRGRIGSKTYITKGSLKVVRHSKYYDYAFNITRQYVTSNGCYNERDKLIILSEDEKQDALNATTLDELYPIIGQPFYVNINCESSIYPGLFLNSIQIAVRKGELEGYDLSVVSISSPDNRGFLQYEEELHMAYRRLVSSLLARKRLENESPVIKSDEIAIQNIIPALEMFYYWVNLSPLCSMTASSTTGYIMLFASILAQDEELVKKLPKYKQLDWEAFFSETPRDFINTISPWFLDRKITTVFDNNISISSIFKTPRNILNLLSKEA